MKGIVAGSRSFVNYALMKAELDAILKKDDVIICGMAKGADLNGKRYAKERELKVIEMPADWKKYGKSAGYKRNMEMAQIADCSIIFWDGKSPGSRHMINISKNMGLKTIVKMF